MRNERLSSCRSEDTERDEYDRASKCSKRSFSSFASSSDVFRRLVALSHDVSTHNDDGANNRATEKRRTEENQTGKQ